MYISDSSLSSFFWIDGDQTSYNSNVITDDLLEGTTYFYKITPKF